MTVCYLEVDDEITGAITRLRAVKDGEAVIVVPHGSRIATSRINFKLLAREGGERRLNLVAVSDDPSVRALAISAGLPAYDSLPAAQQALASFRDQDRRLAERVVMPADAATAETEQTRIMPAAVGPTVEPRAIVPNRPEVVEPAVGPRARRRRVGVGPIVSAALVLLLIAVVAYGAYLFLPTATITLEPAVSTLTLAPVTVVADPDVAVTDVAAGVVPAQRLEIPLSVTATFDATGSQIHETRATGVVRFRSENTVSDVPLSAGTVVSTAEGVDFETTEPAVVPRADFTTSTPGTIDVAVRAVRPGTRGNVAAEAITQVSPSLAGQLVSVRNPNPTEGGARTEERVVLQSDYDAAVLRLDDQLEIALAAELNDPATAPGGLTIFFVSAQTGDAVTDPASSEVVGTVANTFDLTMNSTATVTAVNLALVDGLAETRLRSSLAPGQQIVDDLVHTTHSDGTVIVETVAFDVTPSAFVFTDPDEVALTAAVRGKSVADAQLILAPYGMVDISVWPEFVDRLPDQTARISLVVVSPSPRP